MDCNKSKNNLFLLRVNLAENFNTFSGNLKNINPNLFLNEKFIEKFGFLKGFNNQIQLNGSYKIKTDKNFVYKVLILFQMSQF